VRAESIADVRVAIRFANELGLPVAIHSAGISLYESAGASGGVMIEVSKVKTWGASPERQSIRRPVAAPIPFRGDLLYASAD
jgi:hypothetical protein